MITVDKYGNQKEYKFDKKLNKFVFVQNVIIKEEVDNSKKGSKKSTKK